MRDLRLLTPRTQELHAKFAYAMARAGLNYVVTSTLRTIEEQTALYAQGRETHEKVNALRLKAGMGKLGAIEAAKKVTWTMNSRHLTGRAFDIALIGLDGKTPHWNEKISVNANEMKDYEEAAAIGRSVGLIAGYFWADRDPCHFELSGDI